MGSLDALRHLEWLTGTARVRWCEVLPATSATGCSSGGEWITALRWSHHLGDECLLVAQDPRHFASECSGSSTSSFASASGLSRTMAMSISPPSLWITVGRPACTSARIATALFSHKVRSHSSRALCARVSVYGGALRAAVVPNALRKGLSGGMGDRRC